jgi:hypothetical protein
MFRALKGCGAGDLPMLTRNEAGTALFFRFDYNRALPRTSNNARTNSM